MNKILPNNLKKPIYPGKNLDRATGRYKGGGTTWQPHGQTR